MKVKLCSFIGGIIIMKLDLLLVICIGLFSFLMLLSMIIGDLLKWKFFIGCLIWLFLI